MPHTRNTFVFACFIAAISQTAEAQTAADTLAVLRAFGTRIRSESPAHLAIAGGIGKRFEDHSNSDSRRRAAHLIETIARAGNLTLAPNFDMSTRAGRDSSLAFLLQTKRIYGLVQLTFNGNTASVEVGTSAYYPEGNSVGFTVTTRRYKFVKRGTAWLCETMEVVSTEDGILDAHPRD